MRPQSLEQHEKYWAKLGYRQEGLWVGGRAEETAGRSSKF